MIPAELYAQTPMLATPCSTPGDTCVDLQAKGEHLFDCKWDGVRCLAYIEGDVVMLRNRRGAIITSRYPEIVAAMLQQFAGQTLVLDGELVAFNPTDGKPDFHRIAKRDQLSTPSKIKAAARSIPAMLMIFDVLYSGTTDLRRRPLTERLTHLPSVDGARLAHSVHSLEGAALWRFVNDQQMEGLIAKKLTSTYTGRRDGSWIKLKANKRLTALVTGYVPGEGGRAGQVGALLLSLLDDQGNLVPIGKVGTGFKAADHKALMEVLAAGEEFLVEIEYLEFTRDRQLRMPSWKGVRTDCQRSDASTAQIGH